MLVKDVHHTASKGVQRRSSRTTGRGGYGGGESSRGGRGVGRGVGGESATDQDVWMTATMQLVTDLCARFGEAKGHESPSVEGDAAQQITSRPGGIPVQLHKNATIEAEYHIRWPQDAASKLSGVDIAPLELHYVRVSAEQNTRLVPSHYRRRVPNLREEMDGSITWYDGFERDREKHIARSVDIRIDGIEDGSRSAGSGSGPLTIEILTVEIPDMRSRPATSEPAAPEGNTTASATP